MLDDELIEYHGWIVILLSLLDIIVCTNVVHNFGKKFILQRTSMRLHRKLNPDISRLQLFMVLGNHYIFDKG